MQQDDKCSIVGGRDVICEIKTAFEVLTALLAIAAAGWWFAAAWVSRSAPTWDSLNRVARLQATYNGIAALCAGLAAILQLITTAFTPVCRAFA
jgi:hypothetical protein